MRILITSDTHGQLSKFWDVFKKMQQIDPIDVIVHCGDYYKDAENISKSNQININFCTMDELLKLPGVNEETAAKAVSLREMLGGFNSVQEFIDMTHIEPQYVDQIREKATIRE